MLNMKINLYLIRHGHSEYNEDKNIRLSKYDWDVKLTNRGVKESIELGNRLKEDTNLLDDKSYNLVYISPFKRAKETYFKSKINNNLIIQKEIEEPLISEQRTPLHYGVELKKLYDDFLEGSKGNTFWAKYLDFESGFEVYQRVELFKIKLEKFLYDVYTTENDYSIINVLLFSHGYFIRMMMNSIINLGMIDSFMQIKNPSHCEIIELSREYNFSEDIDIFSNEWHFQLKK